ncbi:MAG: DUF4251 domain-containing protein [Nitrospiraceae bacterium]|nr:DUF4251 domain-containing protein [Nitrospiraceae bacterium]
MMSVLLIASVGYGQSRKEVRKQEKQAKKEARAKEEAVNKKLTKLMIESRKFVLEANFLSDEQGQRISVTSSVNFIVVNGTKGAFQFAEGNRLGYNGLGGATVEGNIQDYKYSVNKKGVYYVEFQIISSVGTIFVTMSVMSPSLRADASIKGNTSAQLNYSGYLVPLDQSRIFKGMSF